MQQEYSSSMELLAVYGTLKQGYGNNRLLKDQEFIGSGKTIDNYSMISFGVPMVYKDPATSPIAIELYKVTKDSLTGPLDRLEGHPTFYRREKIKVTVDEEVYSDVWMYFSSDNSAEYRYGDILEPENGVINWKR